MAVKRRIGGCGERPSAKAQAADWWLNDADDDDDDDHSEIKKTTVHHAVLKSFFSHSLQRW